MAQTFNDFEIIVVDDGSTDNTHKVLEENNYPVHYLCQQKQGRSEARNTGIKTAKGQYIAFLDDDDIWMPDKLEKQINFIDSHPEIGLVHTFVELIDEKGNFLIAETRNRLKDYDKALRLAYSYESMSRICTISISSVMLRRQCLAEVGYFDPLTETFEDWDFYLRFALRYRIATLTESLIRYRVHKNNSTLAEFTRGRINTSLKHIAMSEDLQNFFYRNKILYNFYMHLANAYYIDMQMAMFRVYLLKAVKLNFLTLFHPRLTAHLLMSMLPVKLIQIIKRLR
jgi:glycosyltransferase involved in cell wall biosynthesis